MKRVILAGVSALALVTMMGAANAADLPRRRAEMPVKAPAYMPAFSWTGFYVGINGGGAWGRSNWSASGNSFDTSGGVVGGTVGYNWQAGPTVFGVEGDLDWSGIKGSSTCGGLSCETKNDWLGTFRGRVGYAFNRVMPYVTGGLAVGNVKATSPFGSNDETRAGWTLGGGIEANIVGPWSAKIEYLYADLGRTNCSTCGVAATATDVNFHTNIVRAGVNYHF
ncbi:MAG TPA: outer membrane protein [Pseudolabrys sp.]|jgi:outer membrane immunogenic protein|nr:outer membrane protein [Pseudolabrys sp.]